MGIEWIILGAIAIGGYFLVVKPHLEKGKPNIFKDPRMKEFNNLLKTKLAEDKKMRSAYTYPPSGYRY